MKKILSFIFMLILIFSMTFRAFATNEVFVYEYGNVTVIFEETTAFSAEQREKISDIIASGKENDIETYGLWCTLFGHSYIEDTVTTITHCVRASSPRCLREIFIVGECSRCGDTYSKLNGSNYINCCN